MDKVSYALGLGIGQQLLQMGASDLNIDDFADAIRDVIAGNKLKVSNKDAQGIVENYFKEKETKMNAERAAKGKVAKEAGEQYLKTNANNEGVVTLPSGLQYKVLNEGNGRKPKPPTTWYATMKASSSTEQCSTAATNAENPPHSHSTKSLQDGQKVCN